MDVAVNNAAIYPNTAVVDMGEDEWDAVLDTNLKGAFLFLRAAARAMMAQAARRQAVRDHQRRVPIGAAGRGALLRVKGRAGAPGADAGAGAG